MLRKASPPPDESTLAVRRLMVASEGRDLPYPVIVRALELARPLDAEVFVMSIARVWGTSLGFPNPGLKPTKHEWDEQKRIVNEAVDKFQKAGHPAHGLVLATRKGIIKKTPLEQFERVRSTGIRAITIDDKDELAWVDVSTGEDDVIIATAQGKIARFHETDVRPMGRDAAGVIGIRLARKGDSVVGMSVVQAAVDGG
jgi:DNA gyrase/topoisomerase IV subunit A